MRDNARQVVGAAGRRAGGSGATRMDINQLRYFVCAADRHSFSQAATEHFLTPQAISKQMRALEEELGFKLFARDNKGIEPTEAGQVFLGYARRLTGLAEEAVQQGRQAAGLARPRLTVGSYRNVSAHLLPKVLKAFHTLYPDVEVDFVDLRDFRDIYESLASGRIQATFTFGNEGADAGGVRFLNVHHEPAMCWVGSSGPLAGLDIVRAQDLRGMRAVLAAPGYSRWQDQLRAYLASHEPTVELLEAGGNESGMLMLEDEGVVGLGSTALMTPFSSRWRKLLPFEAPPGMEPLISLDLATCTPDNPCVVQLLGVARHVCRTIPEDLHR